MLGCCKNGQSDCFLGFMPVQIHAEFHIMGLYRYKLFISAFLHFPYDRTYMASVKARYEPSRWYL